MKRILIIVIFATTFIIPSKAQTGVYVPELAAFDSAMQQMLSTYNIPGGQLAISYKGRLVYNRGFGLANVATQDSVTPNSIFRVASVSKPITAVAIMKLYEQNLLKLDDPVFGQGGILNDTVYQDMLDPRDTLITVRMLLQHTAGWDRDISGDVMFDAYNIATVMGVPSPPSASVTVQAILKHVTLDFDPGTKYAYSNFGYCVLGRVIEKITGLTYENYVRDTILMPLGIAQTRLGKNLLSAQLANEVNYYDYPGAPLANSVYDNVTQVPWQYGGFNIEYMDSHGGWVSSAEELVRFVCAIDRFNSRPDMLLAATIDTMVKPSVHNINYACGISVNPYDNWWHNGSLPGTASEIIRKGSNPQMNWAILLNGRDANGDIHAAVDNLVWQVLPNITSWPAHDFFNNNTGIHDFNNKEGFIDIYPNPTKGEIYFSQYTHVKMINVTGQVIISQSNINRLDISAIPAGIYFLMLSDDKGQLLQSSKIVKE